jgi:hypothetical protein
LPSRSSTSSAGITAAIAAAACLAVRVLCLEVLHVWLWLGNTCQHPSS